MDVPAGPVFDVSEVVYSGLQCVEQVLKRWSSPAYMVVGNNPYPPCSGIDGKKSSLWSGR